VWAIGSRKNKNSIDSSSFVVGSIASSTYNLTTPGELVKGKIDNWAGVQLQWNPMVLKRCTKCGKRKTLDRFYFLRGRKDNRHPNCKRCHSRYERQRYRWDTKYRLAKQLRARVRSALLRGAKTGSAVRDLGCSISELKLFLESQFEPGMTWENHGSDWHIDHFVPLSCYDLTDPIQFREATNWLNLQPLWADENLRKGALRPDDGKFSRRPPK
jgi:hypothetical protein